MNAVSVALLRGRRSHPGGAHQIDRRESLSGASRLADRELPGMLWVGDARGRRAFFNRRWLDFTGRPQPQEKGLGWLKGLPADDQRRYLREFRRAARQRTALRITYRLKRVDGQTCRVLEEAQPRFGRDGRVVGFIGVCLEMGDALDAHTETEELRTLSSDLETAREEERARLARELHDELGQVLTSTKLDLMWLCDRMRQPDTHPSVPLVNKLQSLAGLVEVAIATVQRITTDLRPAVLDHLGLDAALEWEATKFQARTGIRCRVISRLDGTTVEPARALALFRIVQESLTNIARHAHAGAVDISLRKMKGRIVLDVQDNGRGITEREFRKRFPAGLRGMQERAHLAGGEFRLVGRAGRGTKVSVWIPIHGSP